MQSDRSPARPPRWVVVFNGPRDGYHLPLALHEAGRLEALVTDWYAPLDRAAFRAAARLFPRGVRDRLGVRYRPGLPSGRVRGTAGALLRQFWRPDWDRIDGLLGARAGRLARRRGAGVLASNYNAAYAFAAYGHGPLPRLVMQVHPHPAWLRTLYEEELARVPEAGSLRFEQELSAPPERFARLAEAPHRADGCIVASAFTRRTLVESGVPEARIRVVPYGVDLDLLQPPAAPPSGPFRVLFVGQTVQRKGLSYLLDAWGRLRLPDAELVLAGRGPVDAELLRRGQGRLRVVRDRSGASLAELYRSSDVFCMPSLAEGFGLVYLEAMACGTPVIGTPNTGAADLVREGENGFVVPIRDPEALAERLLWCYEHRAALAGMRACARRTAEAHSWPAHRRRIVQAVAELAGEHG